MSRPWANIHAAGPSLLLTPRVWVMGIGKKEELTAIRARRNLKIRYEVREHVLEVAGHDGRWTISVDGVEMGGWSVSSADAWTAGVTEADRLDKLASS
jgi:hypothetical protein